MLKNNLVIALPYLGKLFLQIPPRKNRIMKNKLPYCNLCFLQRKYKSSNCFTFKSLISGIVYKLQYGDSNATYYCKAKRHCVKTLEFWDTLEKEVKAMPIL